jgi:hypothetical protein
MKSKILFIFIAFTTFCNAQIVNIPDLNFKNALLASTWQWNSIAKNINGSNMIVDTNSDGEIQLSEALLVYEIHMTPNIIGNNNTINLEGINSFINLRKIFIDNKSITNINFNSLLILEELSIRYCAISNFSVENCPIIKRINFDYNQFTSLDFSSLPQLESISCSNNILLSLNLTGLHNLTYINCSYNNLVSLNVQGLSNINGIKCNNNQITHLNLNGLNTLQTIEGQNNQLNNVSFEGCSYLDYAYLSDNLLSFLDFNQCTSISGVQLFNNPTMEGILIKNGVNEYLGGLTQNAHYICCDTFEVDSIKNSYPNTEVNTYCSFVPGGTYFLVNGTNKLDIESNGCTSLDPVYPNFKINFTDGITPKTLIPDNSGFYSIPVGTGSFILTPILDNPTYYNVSPTTASASFPANTSPAIRDFCITPNGIHHDVEITIIPTTIARPGFDAKYKLVFKNKGNQIENGSVSFTLFNEDVLDYVISNPAFNTQNSVSNETTYVWNFTNLLQFESREIEIILNLNSPTETPALNSGDLLNYTASVNGQTDETPNDNIAILNQLVVNAYDPNDKTCLEGTMITPSMVGEYVHYLIRFENNGTANAQNVVVKDVIDTSKFDINTLIPINGSHNFETRISSTNKVEFIFQNINLPLDDANNDGYVAFKIKTKPNLIVGDTFSNSANIYFDYNFPIVTNNYTTTVQNTLGLQENDFMNDIVAYPNPVKDFLKFKTKHNISKIEVYDIAGRILSSNSVSENEIDLSELKPGNYVLKIYTEKGIINTKIAIE